MTRSGVNRLPDELLVMIFIHCRQIFQRGLFQRDKPRALSAFTWTHLMLVCRLWREVALATAALWNMIDIPRPALLDPRYDSYRYWHSTTTGPKENTALKWLNLILSRSARMPLELVFARPEYGTAALPILATESRRIRSLTFPDSDTLQSIDPVLSVLQLDLPAIMELNMLYDEDSTLKNADSRPEQPPERRAKITSERYPSLRILRLSNFTLHNASASIYPQLERLDLRFCSFDGHLASLSNLLDALVGCPNLVELQLHFVLSMLTDGAPPPASRTISLLKLQKLVLRDVPLFTRRFLDHISIPTATTLRVIGIVDDPDPVFDVLNALIVMVPPPKPLHLPIFRSLTQATIENEGPSLLQLSSPTTKLSLQALSYGLSDLPSCLVALRTLCFESPLTTLEIDGGDLDDIHGMLPWRELFGVFGNLKSLKVGAIGSTIPMICALGHTPVKMDDDADAEVDDTPACPHLRELIIGGMLWERGLVEALTGVLRLRENYGLPQLEMLTLSLECYGEEDPDEHDETMDRYEDEVLNLVGRFEWGW